MSDMNELVARIDGAITAVKEKVKARQQEELKHFQEGQKLLKEYEKVQAKIVEVARPRLEALAKRANERVSVTPSVSESGARRGSSSSRTRPTSRSSSRSRRTARSRTRWWSATSRSSRAVEVRHPRGSSPPRSRPRTWRRSRSGWTTGSSGSSNSTSRSTRANSTTRPSTSRTGRQGEVPEVRRRGTLDHGGQTYFFIDAATRGRVRQAEGDRLSPRPDSHPGGCTHESRRRRERTGRFDRGLRPGDEGRRPRGRAGR